MAMMVSAPQLRGEGHSRPRKVASRTLTRRGARARKTMTVSTLDMERLFMLQYTSYFLDMVGNKTISQRMIGEKIVEAEFIVK